MFSEEFKRERVRLDLSQQAMSDELNIPKRTIENWESGVNAPPEWVQRLVLAELKSMKRSE